MYLCVWEFMYECVYMCVCVCFACDFVFMYVCMRGGFPSSPGSIPSLESSPGEGNCNSLQYSWASLVAQMVKNLPAMRETWVWSLGWEDPLEVGMVTHSSILAWRISWTEEPGRLQFMGLQRVWCDWVTKRSTCMWGPMCVCMCLTVYVCD